MSRFFLVLHVFEKWLWFIVIGILCNDHVGLTQQFGFRQMSSYNHTGSFFVDAFGILAVQRLIPIFIRTQTVQSQRACTVHTDFSPEISLSLMTMLVKSQVNNVHGCQCHWLLSCLNTLKIFIIGIRLIWTIYWDRLQFSGHQYVADKLMRMARSRILIIGPSLFYGTERN